MAHTCQIEVRWGDSDRLGHVNNVLYAEYAQESRVRFFRESVTIGGPLHPLVVRKLSFDYLRPVTDETAPLTVELTIPKVGTSSFAVHQVMRDRTGAVCAEVDSVMVAFDPVTEQAVPLPDRIREQLRTHAPVDVTS
ncbi:acyl-CoA thioesterase [Rhodococcus sp. NPDC058505]|uniref:acyl-CoA thioesterase n=1 Tax=Rhodococcus sp. NPDC058505 TaxID=3346531 RepID=UPI003659B389